MDKKSIGAIILAAGKGTRLNSKDKNKVTLPFAGKPMIHYAVDRMREAADHVVVVVGAFEESVRESLKDYPDVIIAKQEEQLGTGHATMIGLKELEQFNPQMIYVGYGDHMMFYKSETMKKLMELHDTNNAAISLVTVIHDNPDELAWGRVVKNTEGMIVDIVEQKDADEQTRKIEELNAGFYLFDYEFLKEYVAKLDKSPATNEYYLTELIKIAGQKGLKVNGLPVEFEDVGIGINKTEELEQSESLYSSRPTE